MNWKWLALGITAGVLSTIAFYWVLTPAVPTAKISRVVDGDTFYIVFLSNSTTEKVRIWGIDTPEEYKTSKLYKDARRCNATADQIQQLGLLATQHAKHLLSNYNYVAVQSKGHDIYNRLLAKIYLLPNSTNQTEVKLKPHTPDYGLTMISDGFACPYWPNTSQLYIDAYKSAKTTHRGLWHINPDLMQCLCSPTF